MLIMIRDVYVDNFHKNDYVELKHQIALHLYIIMMAQVTAQRFASLVCRLLFITDSLVIQIFSLC